MTKTEQTTASKLADIRKIVDSRGYVGDILLARHEILSILATVVGLCETQTTELRRLERLAEVRREERNKFAKRLQKLQARIKESEEFLKGYGRYADYMDKTAGEYHKRIEELEEGNTAMVKQLKDQDLRTEKQHREWYEKTLEDKARIEELESLLRLSTKNQKTLAEELRRVTKEPDDDQA